ncbi:sensor histidine kinase [Parasediminibacterium sp. JCM 36343]|uniref:sensor histidine kinase n=1 Tax=Parasediminibacterium sp. JCM 36343 TaxID=3374279 RepID=UPI00397B20E6
MVNDLKFSFVNIDQESLSMEMKAKAKYYANVIHWTLIYALPLFWLLDYSFLSADWLWLFAIRICIVFLSHCFYIYGGLAKNNWGTEMTLSIIVGLNTFFYASICSIASVSSILPYFLLFSIFFVLLNITVFWKPFYSILQCLIAYGVLIVFYKLFNKYDGYDVLIANGGGIFFVLSAFSCLIGFNRYQIAKKEILKNLIIEVASNRVIEQNEKINDQQNEIKEVNRKLNKLSEYRYSALNMILHDFRNFTGSIQMSLDLLKETNENFTAEQTEILGYIGVGNEKLKYLSEKMANSAESESSQIDYNYTDIDFGKAVEQVTMDMSDAATMKQIKLQLNIDPSSTIVYLDKIFLDQVLVKLMSNVVRYSASNTIVSIHLHKVDNKAVLDIANKGKILGSKKLEQLFNGLDELSQSHGVATQTTLGFSVAKTLAEQMGGKLTYNSDESTGNFYRLEFNLSK